ncbi:AAA family ATPase [Sporosalibacterium faouarense]|uniref:AAA family ATPase n=1 Tax=Sporosalibacterium faouarense TaxID=516123 RepID=UPI00141C091D|nr:MoxR family ATPase [Sporosalibacterium faouarense]MTI47409.1 MoxR family ATPase [Bacillota bacterium]
MILKVNDIQEMAGKIKRNIQQVIVGKDKVIDLMLTSILCSGHVLLEDVPGLGKTMLAKSLSKSVNSTFKRIQFTPDLLPSDVTGINVYNQKTGEFNFKKGPLMSQIVLADEINRATPRTQSSLLEAMEEHQVSVDGITYKLDEPFFVIATQNPVETGGTFPLPEAQLDRFFMQLSMEYPDFNEEMEILRRFRENNPFEDLKPVVNSEDIVEARKCFTDVFVDEEIMKYLLEIVRATREHEEIELGISPRGSMALFRGIQAYAAIQGRDYVLPDDVKELVRPIFIHRIILNGQAAVKGRNTIEVLDDIINSISTPVENLQAI